MYSSSFEASIQVFLKSKSIEGARKLIASPSWFHHLHPIPDAAFSERNYLDAKRRKLTIKNDLFVDSLSSCADIVDLGVTAAPKLSAVERVDLGEGGQFRLFSAIASVRGYALIKATTNKRAVEIRSGFAGTVFHLLPSDERFFSEPPLTEAEVDQVSFGTQLTIHASQSTPSVQRQGTQAPCDGDGVLTPHYRRLLYDAVDRPYPPLIEMPFAIRQASLPTFEAEFENWSGPCSPRSYSPRPLFMGWDVTVVSNGWGVTVCLDGADPFLVSEPAMQFLARQLGVVTNRNRSISGNAFRLDCRYLTLPGLEPWLDIYRETHFSGQELIDVTSWPTRVGKFIDQRSPVVVHPGDQISRNRLLECTAIETKYLSAINPVFFDYVDSFLWTPDLVSDLAFGDSDYRTIRVPIAW